MVENYLGPMTVDETVRKPGHLVTGQLARAIMKPSEKDATEAVGRVRGYVQRQYLHPVGIDGVDQRKPKLFTRDHALLAAILDRALEFNIRDAEFMQAIATVQGWRHQDEQHPDYKSPLALIWAVFDAAPSRAPGFSVRVQWLRDAITEQRSITAGIINPSLNLSGRQLNEFRPGWYPVGEMVIGVDMLLPDLARRLAAMRVEH